MEHRANAQVKVKSEGWQTDVKYIDPRPLNQSEENDR